MLASTGNNELSYKKVLPRSAISTEQSWAHFDTSLTWFDTEQLPFVGEQNRSHRYQER
jgi:hypothetical protein